jgi:hypothetical protein
LHKYTYIHLAILARSPSSTVAKTAQHAKSSIDSHLFRRPVGVNGAHSLGGVRAAFRLLALLVGLVDGDGVPGRAVGHARLLGRDLALLVGVGLGEAGLGGRGLYLLISYECSVSEGEEVV